MSENKNPLWLLGAIAVGALLMSTKKKEETTITIDDMPSSIDYEDDNLKEALADSAESESEDE